MYKPEKQPKLTFPTRAEAKKMTKLEIDAIVCLGLADVSRRLVRFTNSLSEIDELKRDAFELEALGRFYEKQAAITKREKSK